MAFRILCIDGGGIRGIIPATVLAEIERRTGRAVSDLFDLVAGTSTGGIIALALTKAKADGSPEWRAEDLVPLYVEEGPKIFSRDLFQRIRSANGLLDEKYDAAGLERSLGRYLDGARLAAARTQTVVTAYETRLRSPFFFRSVRAAQDPAYDYAIGDAARATASAPTYFQPARIVNDATLDAWSLIDGGVFANNPALVALADALAAGHAPRDILLVSLGTGEHTRPLPWEKVKDWGLVEWAKPIIDVVFDGASDTTSFQAEQILGAERFFRLQIELNRANDDLDDASPRNLDDLKAEAARLLRDEEEKVRRICDRLTA